MHIRLIGMRIEPIERHVINPSFDSRKNQSRNRPELLSNGCLWEIPTGIRLRENLL